MKNLILLLFFSVGVCAQSNDWTQTNPWPTGQSPKVIWSFDQNTAIIGCDEGEVLKTTDGGQNWRKESFGPLVSAKSIFFVDNLNGWMAFSGESNFLVRTTDGGESWNMIWYGSTIRSVFFVNQTTGWLAKPDEILKTTNGGESWFPVYVNSGFTFNELYFINQSTGWAVGGSYSDRRIFKTTNGGQTWVQQTAQSGLAFYSVCFIDSNKGFTVGSDGLIFATTNGGLTWQQRFDTQLLYLNFIRFSDPMNGWVGGYSGFFRTTDGGNTWLDISANYPDFEFNAFHASNASQLWGVGSPGLIIKSTDGGDQWQRIDRGFWDNIYSLHFINKNIGWAVAAYHTSFIYKTTDGGDNWAQLSGFGNEIIQSVFFIDANYGWAASLVGNIYYTTNGGLNWLLGTSSTTYPIKSLFFINQNVGWACGHDKILKTTNGGLNWFEPHSIYQNYNSVFFINDTTGWVVTSTPAVIYKTINGGQTWFNQHTASSYDISDIRFINENFGIAAGSEGKIYRTTNGGTVWEEINTYSGALMAVDARTENEWYAVGNSGAIIRSTDGGQIWTPLAVITYNDLSDIQFVSPDRGWIGGRGGIVLRYGQDQLAPEPTAQPTNLTFSEVTVSGFRTQFDHASPAADGYIAVRRKGAEPDFTPVDGTPYSVMNVFGENEIAYVGPNNVFIETSLLPNNEYFYKIYSYNGSGDTINYLTVNPLEGSQATLFSSAILVTNPNDFMEGSLRWAIDSANAHIGADTILFALPKGTILNFMDVLPAIEDDGTTINGDMDADGSPDIILYGGGVIEGSIINILSSHCVIKGLVLQGQTFYAGAAITIDGGHYNKVIGCYIGTDITGMASAQNYCGVKITNGATFNQIGDGTAEGRNVISGNREGIGIWIMEPGTRYNIVAGNHIGLNAAGFDSLPNLASIMISGGARGNRIGGHTEGERNFIYSCLPPGQITDEFSSGSVQIMSDATDSNYVIGNWFGLAINGNSLSGQNIIGIMVGQSAAHNFIGDGLPGGGNVIANSVYGVLFHYADSNYVFGNLIGTDPTGNNAVPNETGVMIRKSSYNQVGGMGPLFRNVISGNSNRGVEILANNITFGMPSNNNKIIGNYIGVKSDGVNALGNANEGIFFDSKFGWSVTFNAAEDNVIANNGTYGVSFNGQWTYSNSLFKNSVYNNNLGGIFIDNVAQNNTQPPRIDSIVGHTVYGSIAYSNALIQLYWDEGNQGQHFIDTVRESGDGYWSYILPDSVINYNITALQTRNFSTSAFSEPVMVMFPLIVNRLNPYSGPGTLDYAVTYANNNPGPDSIKFKLPPQTIIYSDLTFTLTSNGTVIDGDMNQDGIPDIGIARRNIYLQSAVAITGNNNTVKNILIGGYRSQYHEATLYITGQQNKILGNYLGVDFSGNLGTGWDLGHNTAVKLASGAKYNVIGDGSVPGRNIIANSAVADIHISGIGTDSNSVLGNYIGLNKTGSDTIDGGMGQMNVVGILISDGAKNNFIGNGTESGRNIISGHRSYSAMTDNGIRIEGAGTDYNEINGNYIGTDPTGTEARPNVTGVYVTAGAQYNSVKNNLISGNIAAGVVIESAGTSHNIFYGNIIGLNVSGNAALPNEKGVLIIGAKNNQIGYGTIPGRNIISGNTYHGIQTMSDSGNVIVANYIGTDFNGNIPMGNLQNGIFLSDNSRYNLIDRNLISGNGIGIQVLQTTPIMPNRNHVITGNFIGTNAAGTTSIGNVHGIVMRTETGGEVMNNFIGDGNTAGNNLISGNDSTGILLEGNAHDNHIYGNIIGLDLAGNSALSNGGDGIRLQYGANNNTIGHTELGTPNIISGNLLNGIVISDGSHNNIIQRNYIGTGRNGTGSIGNGANGIWIYNSNGTIIGNGANNGTNVLAGNCINNPTGDYAGIFMDHAAYTMVDKNHVGTDINGVINLGNHGYGIRANNSHYITLRSNHIAYNDSGGIVLGGTGLGNLFHRIHYNQYTSNRKFNLLITESANSGARTPHITGVQSGNILTGKGMVHSMIQIYRAYPGNVPTLTFIDTTYSDAVGNWSKSVAMVPGTQFTALSDTAEMTSMFSPIYQPLIGVPGTSPVAMNFGNCQPGDSMQNILKIGTNAFPTEILGVISLQPDIFKIDSMAPQPGTILNPGDTMFVYVTFKPQGYISYVDSLRIDYTNAPVPLFVRLSGAGSGIGNLTLSKNDCPFGQVVVNTEKRDTVYLSANNGPVQIDTIAFAQNNAFTLTSSIQYPHILNSGETLSMVIRFLPPDTGSFSDVMNIVNNSGVSPLSVTMNGTGITTALTATPNPLAFGAVQVSQSSSDTVIITPVGGTVILNSASALSAPFSATLPSFPRTLNIGESLKIPVRFSPTGVGTFSDSLILTNNSNAGALKIMMSGTGFNTGITATPNPVAFGNVQVSTTAFDTVMITAAGGTVILNGASALSAPFSATLPSFPRTLNIGESLKLPIRFSPTAAGTFYDSLMITNNSNAGPLKIMMNGTGVSSTGDLTASNYNLNFAPVVYGDSSTATFKLYATGGNVNITSALLNHSTHFRFNPFTPITLNNGDSLTVSAKFIPQSTGTFTDSLIINNNSIHNPLIVKFSGTSNPGTLSLSSGSINYNNVRLTDSATQTVKIKSGSGIVTISAITLDIGLTDYQIINPSSLPVNLRQDVDSLMLSVKFKPLTAGSKSDSVRITSNAVQNPLFIRLNGVGQANNIPNAFALKAVGTNNLTNNRMPIFAWEGKGDPDSDALTYILEVSKQSNFSVLAYRDTTADTTLTSKVMLDSVGSYYWRVTAHDGWGGSRTSNTGYFRIDAVPASLTAGTFFSSVLKQYISVNVISTKLMRSLNASIGLRNEANSLVDSTTKTMGLISPADRFYQTPYQLTSAGKLFIMITGTDSAQNTASVNKNYTVSTIAKDQALAMNSDNGQWQITAPKRTVEEDGYVMVNELNQETVMLKNQSALTMAKAAEGLTAVGDGLNIQGSVSIIQGQGFTVTMRYDEDAVSELQTRYSDFDERKIGLYAEDNGAWMYIGGEGRSGQVQAKMKQYGMVKLMYNPDHEFLPTKLELAQNYPNPFNPTTTIRFGIPQEGKVKLTIYNVLGQKVTELVNDSRNAGYYNVIWNGRNERGMVVSSGVYLYKLETAEGVVVKKMILVK